MEILVILDGKIIYTHMDAVVDGQVKDREARYADAISAAVAESVLNPYDAPRAFCKLGQP